MISHSWDCKDVTCFDVETKLQIFSLGHWNTDRLNDRSEDSMQDKSQHTG